MDTGHRLMVLVKSDTEAHHVFNSRDDLCKNQLCFKVIKPPSGGNSGEQVSTAAILHHQM